MRRAAKAGPSNYETFIQQNRAYGMIDVLAGSSHPSRPRSQTLIAAAHAVLFGPGREKARAWFKQTDRRMVLSVARILQNSRFYQSAGNDAFVLFRAALEVFGYQAMPLRDRLMCLEAATEQGYAREFNQLRSALHIPRAHQAHLQLLKANLVRPFTDASPVQDVADASFLEWADTLNVLYRERGLEPLVFEPGTAALMDRIITAPVSAVEDGPLVTVIVPSFDADERIDTAVLSLLRQSYRNLEIFLVDDHTPGGVPQALARWEGADRRITVLRMERNGGSYRARNHVLTRLAHGELFTVHDDDDWSHPRKIEVQVRHLLESGAVANMSFLSRATPNLEMRRINNNANYIQRNYSSLMFRRQWALEHLGLWDEVNRSGDAEFIDRIRQVTGADVEGVGDVPLSFLRVRADSLTSGEISRGYIDPRRRWYQLATRAGLRARAEQEAVATSDSVTEVAGMVKTAVPAVPPQPVAYSTPADFRGTRSADRRWQVDVLYVTDFRFPGGNSTLSAAEVRVLVEAGLTVGLAQIDSPLNGIRSEIHPAILEASVLPGVTVLSRMDQVDARCAILRHPSIGQFLATTPIPWSISGGVALVANHAAVDASGHSVYDIATAVDRLSQALGRPVPVFAESVVTRQGISGRIPRSLLRDEVWPGIVRAQGEDRPASWVSARTPVIGRHGRDHEIKWPGTPEAVLAAYPVDGSVRVRVLGGADVPSRVTGMDLSEHWEVLPYGAVPVDEFLSGVDVWVYAHSNRLRESFGMAAAEAMAAGVPTILPPYMESTFGDGAIYCTVPQIAGAVASLWSDPQAYAAQSARGRAVIAERYGTQAFLDRVRRLMGENGCRV